MLLDQDVLLTTQDQKIIIARNQRMSPLLRLPSEMRNLIMDYAICELVGLHYQSDLGGIDRLYPNLDLITKVK
ncbi:hypothetical protein HBH69_000760 [Parastagonospora nodorum]|nr:hypothetical protein HBH51_125540 [Parastagonospora nodorum]KAH3990771.1 hypothetical protein HBH52_010380 [Parastagonospora nodorum]KAH4006589.1 hypothetical protein HBI10_020800 [Parastagonospora nodorum]KAH4008550.1 hypothetical protein HBI13_235270 [Parastagonospora nodorum]KAH4121069.1 hypothetical protein HBH47_104360 [Parastagonospora nodorum]